MANFRAQAVFRMPFGNLFPTLKMMDFQINLVLDVPKSVKFPKPPGSFRKFGVLVHFANIFQL